MHGDADRILPDRRVRRADCRHDQRREAGDHKGRIYDIFRTHADQVNAELTGFLAGGHARGAA